MPWQRQVADVMGEIGEDGRYHYKTAIVIVSRRAGKTALILATLLARASELPDRRCYYTAQDRTTAAALFRDEWVPAITSSRLLARSITPRLSNGSEALAIAEPGRPRLTAADLADLDPARPRHSTIALYAPGPNAIHSRDADTVVVDEAWSLTDVRGRQIESGALPAMAIKTRRPQYVVVSAGGTAASTYLLDLRDRHRHGASDRVAYFEWSADPDVDDLDDPATLHATHPALGHTIDADTLLADRAHMSTAEWNRAYLSVFTTTAADAPDLAYPGERFAALASTYDTTALRPVIAFDAALDRAACAIAAGFQLPDGRTAVELVETVPTALAAARLAVLRRSTRARLVADARGNTAAIVDALRHRGTSVDVVTSGAVAAAYALMLDAIDRASVTHPGDLALVDALASAERRRVGDAHYLTRGTLPAAIAIAATVAHAAAAAPHATAVVAH